jgi:hypothetical protein
MDPSVSNEGKPTKAGVTRRIANSVAAALLMAGAALVFYEVLLAISQADMVVTADGWLFVGGLSILCGCVTFAILARTSLAWRFVIGGIAAILVASGVLFLFGLLLALMSGIG